MSTFRHILAPTDFGEVSERATERALDLARDLRAKVTLVHVAPLPPYYYAAYAEGLAWPTEELEGAAQRAMAQALEAAKRTYDDVDSVLLTGAPSAKILEAAAERKADLIVMGTHGRRGLARAVLGSVAEKIVRTSPVPVLTVSGE